MMHLNEKRRVVRNAVALLGKAGSEIVAFNLSHSRPVIEINFPTVRLSQKAIAIVERVGGAESRTIYVARFNSCVIRWTDGLPEAQTEQCKALVSHLNEYSTATNSVWPKNF